jgi:hypothetical protein
VDGLQSLAGMAIGFLAAIGGGIGLILALMLGLEDSLGLIAGAAFGIIGGSVLGAIALIGAPAGDARP